MVSEEDLKNKGKKDPEEEIEDLGKDNFFDPMDPRIIGEDLDAEQIKE